jgi:D-glycero-alpha-D-manno-heptose-7-phosphate kinase
LIISKTPLRISFFGGGTDLPEYFNENRGAVLGSAIDKFVYVSINRFYSALFDYRIRLAYRISECVTDVSDIQHKPAREILSDVGITRDVEIAITADLPAFSGLGSSSSFSVGLIHAAQAFVGSICEPSQLATAAIRIERDVLMEKVGCQDQTFAAFGGFNLIEFLPGKAPIVTPVHLQPSTASEIARGVMLFYTGVRRKAQDIEGRKIASMAEIRSTLDRMLLDVDQGIKLLTVSQDIEAFGRLLGENWHHKRTLDPSVSSPEIDQLYNLGIKSGAFGGKLLGAGGGGFMLFVCDPSKQFAIRHALKDFVEIPVQLFAEGSKIIHNSLGPP